MSATTEPPSSSFGRVRGVTADPERERSEAAQCEEAVEGARHRPRRPGHRAAHPAALAGEVVEGAAGQDGESERPGSSGMYL